MSKVYLNSTELKSPGLVALKDAISAVNKALNYFDYFDIPGDFSMKNNLKDVESKLRNIKKNLDDAKKWIVESNSDYNTLLEKLDNKASSLATYKVNSRTSKF